MALSTVADYSGYPNWITGHIAVLIDNSESTLNAKRRLTLNALRKGIGIDQLANQFRRMFEKQEDETRKGARTVATGRNLIEKVDWRAIAWKAAEDTEMEIRVQDKKRAPEDTKHDKHPPEFRFRLNGEIMPEIFVQRALIDGEPIGEWQIAVEVDGLRRFTLDDNSNLWDPALPQFVLEFRDETSWALLPIPDRQASKDKGWNCVTPQELVTILQSEGLISSE
jgi:hypothetical protein